MKITIPLDFLPTEGRNHKWYWFMNKKSKARRSTREDTCTVAKTVDAEPLEYAHVDILCIGVHKKHLSPKDWGDWYWPIICGLRDAGILTPNGHLRIQVFPEVCDAFGKRTFVVINPVDRTEEEGKPAMRIYIIRDIETPKGKLEMGDIIEVKPKVAQRWVDDGRAKLPDEKKKRKRVNK